MFSANENILLRQHKRKVIELIEATIPENALDLGTTVMVMQVSCRQPGCVPLETAITIVFPKPPKKSRKKEAEDQSTDEVPAFPKPLIPGLEESRIGGSFKTRILKPLAEVTNDDILDALPPEFKGGRRTIESICLRARDTVFAQIGQLVGNDDTTDSREGRRLVAEYLQKCLAEYVERDCIAPEWGEDFTPVEKDLDQPTAKRANEEVTMDNKWGKGNIVFRRPVDGE
jgi:hypothetical protein